MVRLSAQRGDVRAAKKLLDAGADLTARDEHLRSTPLAWAAKFGQLKMVKFLLKRGAPETPARRSAMGDAPRVGHPAWARQDRTAALLSEEPTKKQNRRRVGRAKRIPVSERIDVTRAEFNRAIAQLNERAEIMNDLRHNQEMEFQRLAQLQAEVDLLRRAFEKFRSY